MEERETDLPSSGVTPSLPLPNGSSLSPDTKQNEVPFFFSPRKLLFPSSKGVTGMRPPLFFFRGGARLLDLFSRVSTRTFPSFSTLMACLLFFAGIRFHASLTERAPLFSSFRPKLSLPLPNSNGGFEHRFYFFSGRCRPPPFVSWQKDAFSFPSPRLAERAALRPSPWFGRTGLRLPPLLCG